MPRCLRRRWITKDFGTAFRVGVIPTLRDNFSYLIHDSTTDRLAVVDLNSDWRPVQQYVEAEVLPRLPRPDWRVELVLTTHKHWDHAGGNAQAGQLASTNPPPSHNTISDTLNNKDYSQHKDIDLNTEEGMPNALNVRHANGEKNDAPIINENSPNTPVIVGGMHEKVPHANRLVREGDSFAFGQLRIEVLEVPCHTSGHVAYKVFHPARPEDGVAVFTGDTLFCGGIGAFFEGTARDMCAAMRKFYYLNNNNNNSSTSEEASVRQMDEKTFIFPGHEYTLGFIKFARDNFPDRTHADFHFIQDQLGRYERMVEQEGVPSVPSSLAEEKRQNLFLRVGEKQFQSWMCRADEVELMEYLYNTCD